MAFIARRLARHPLKWQQPQQQEHHQLRRATLSLDIRALLLTARQPRPIAAFTYCPRCYSTRTTPEAFAKLAPKQKIHGRTMTLWTDEMDKTLLKLKAEGKNWTEIGHAIGVSPPVCSLRFDKHLDPALKEWDVNKMNRLDSLVELGLSWGQIGARLGSSARQCQYIWKIRGRGQYKFRAILNVPNAENWCSYEVEAFWRAWFQYGQSCFRAAVDDMPGREIAVCHKSMLYFVSKALEGAPGWAQIEILHFVSQAIGNARGKPVVMNPKAEGDKGDSITSTPLMVASASKWTPKEHEALLKAVEKHGLFANWDEIRDTVKPTFQAEEVKREYWRLSGMAGDDDLIDGESRRSKSAHIRTGRYDSLSWSNEEVEALNLMLMKYSTMRSWQVMAEEKGVSASPIEDLQTLFGGKTVPAVHCISHNDSRSDGDTTAPALWDIILRDRLRFLVEYQQLRAAKTGNYSEMAVDWDWTANHIGPGITADDCKTQWDMIDHTRMMLSVKKPSQSWSQDELHTLIKALETRGKRWTKIRTEFLPHRSTDSIRRKFRLLVDARKHALEESIQREFRDDPDQLEEKLKELESRDDEYALIRRMERAVASHK